MPVPTYTLFVYGTLCNVVVRFLVCGRRVPASPGYISGYRRVGRTLIPDPNGRTSGLVLTVTKADLVRLDRYERVPLRYYRVYAPFGTERYWVYIKRGTQGTRAAPPASI